jgi:hypothetical protein
MGTPDRLVQPSIEEFARVRGRRPVLLAGLVGDGEIDRWSLAALRERCGNRQASVIPLHDGRIGADARRGVMFDAVRFGDYLDRLERGDRPDAYLAVPPETWLPEVHEAFPPPEYCRRAAWRNSRLWISGPETSVPLHHDVAENIFIQLVGRKRFLLYPATASPWLYSNPFRSALPNFSRFDPEAPDYARFPLSRAVRPVSVVVGPGDALYLPSRWWHQVRSLELSVSINFWFADGWLARIVRLAEFVKRARKLEIYGLEAQRAENAPGRTS